MATIFCRSHKYSRDKISITGLRLFYNPFVEQFSYFKVYDFLVPR